MAPQTLSTVEEYKKLVDSVEVFLLDCDGVIYHGPQVVPGVKEVLKYLRSIGKRILFVTNNASKSRRMYKSTFDKLGIEVSENEIFGSAYASAVYMSKILQFPKDKRVYVIGQAGLEEELDAVGIAHAGGSDPEDRVFIDQGDYSSVVADPSIGAVLCGFDAYINYKKYSKAYTYLKDNEGCHFLLTNQDATFPTNGTTYPGSGAMSAPLVFASKRTPTIIGKPNKIMMDAIIAEHHFDPAKALMVGDNLSTDIEFGLGSGVRTLLVFGGVTKREQVFGDNASETVPDFVMESLGDLAVLAKEK
ncbi:HAD-like domain-containing protein [Dioszegia hungarica]|uniref:4-nitrophenylphosphatase n=1 Tax=Dioszegia hungarica TaxID=4972 RepID=A0AA38HFD7_9TREE|nr:HAD-like domain-containing protein [Dioszegia hungarica]KAI9637914.1 HAD-like domain-containing protein [Dioszegia hungarica]